MSINTEVRYAIIVGINNYTVKPLECCVNDAVAVAEILEKRCRFVKENIKTITSSNENPNKEIWGTLEYELALIEKKFVASQDSILFYFAGHGYKNQSDSVLMFDNLEVKISSIFDKLNNLSPKFQMYIIDACESGGKVLTRGTKTEENFIDRLIGHATGILFMYASTDEERVDEMSSLGHGIFTHFLLKVIEDDTNYKDSFLSPSMIQDRIAFETQQSTKFKQNPVIENRSAGFYPFAFLNPVVIEENNNTEEQNIKSLKPSLPQLSPLQQFPYIDPEQFDIILLQLTDILNHHLEELIRKVDIEIFDYKLDDSFDALGIHAQKAIESIVLKSRMAGIEAIENNFYDEQIDNKSQRRAFSFISSFLNEFNNNIRTYYRISWYSAYVIGKSFILKSKSINAPDCGLGIVIYRAKYGLGIGIVNFHTDWDGVSEQLEQTPIALIKGYKINDQTIIKAEKQILQDLNEFSHNVQRWSKDRQIEINNADEKYL